MQIPKLPSKQVIVGVIVCSIVIIVIANVMYGGQTYRGMSRVTTASLEMPMGMPAPMMDMYVTGQQVSYGETSNKVRSYGMERGGDAGYVASTVVVPNEHKEVKEGSLSLAVTSIDDAIADIRMVAQSAGGFVHMVSVTGSRGVKSGMIGVRVPNDTFDDVVAEIKASGVRVITESEHTTDVTLQYVDLESRIRAMKVTEEQYLSILKRSGEVKDVLAVTEQLARVRESIERLEGERNYLGQQIAMSTITVSLTEEADPSVVKEDWRPMQMIKDSVTGMLRYLAALAMMMIAIVIWTPVMLLQIALLVLVAWILWKIAVFAVERVTGKKLARPFTK